MIMVTRLNDSTFAVNPDLIARVHASPDTTLVMVDGASYVVAESLDQIVAAIVAFRARVISRAQSMIGADEHPRAVLAPVPMRPGTV